MQKKRAHGWVSVSPDHEVTLKNRATTYLSYYYCICSVDKNHQLHRRWINPFPQLLASHNLNTNVDVNNSIQDQKLKVQKNRELQFSRETPPNSGIRANKSLISSRKAGHVVPIPFLVLGIRVLTIVAGQSLQFGMVF